ncbi:M16 family metallopeptidase, partial [Prevotella jejuni]
KAEYLSQLESAYVNRNKVKNAQYGDELRDHYLSNEPIPSKEDDYQIMKQLIEMPALNVDVINKYAQELITDKDSNFVAYIFAQDKAGATYPTEAQMAQTINAVRAEKIEPYVDNVKQEPLLDEKKLPKAGKIVSEKENKVLGFKELTLSNGARVILKKTNFKDNEIQFQALAKGGKGLYGKADFSNLQLFETVIGYSGLGNFSRQELQKALSGKQASMSCGLSSYYQSVGGSCVPKDIETMMQLLYLNFTNVAKDEASYKAMMAQLELGLKNKDLSPESVFSDSLSLTIFGHEPRFAPMTLNTLKNVNYDRILQIWKERFANPGQFVYYFVGNFDESSLRPLIEKYIASLPKGKVETWKEVPSYVNGNVVNKFTRKSETPKAIAFEFWHAPMAYTLENEILTSAAAQVLSMVYLKSIREDASAAYSVSAGGSLRRLGNKSTAVIQAYCPMDPAKSDLALKLLAEGIKDNTVKMDADKVQKVKDFMLKDAELAAKNNGHWMDILDEYVWTGVDFQTNYKKTVEAITPAKLAAYLKQILAAGNHAEVVMTPAK